MTKALRVSCAVAGAFALVACRSSGPTPSSDTTGSPSTSAPASASASPPPSGASSGASKLKVCSVFGKDAAAKLLPGVGEGSERADAPSLHVCHYELQPATRPPKDLYFQILEVGVSPSAADEQCRTGVVTGNAGEIVKGVGDTACWSAKDKTFIVIHGSVSVQIMSRAGNTGDQLKEAIANVLPNIPKSW